METLEYSLKSGREDGITDPVYLREIESFAQWFRTQPEVSHVQVFSDVMKRLNKNMHDDDPAFDRLPEDPELSAQYLLLYELSLPFGSDLNNRMDVAKSATRMTVVLRSLTSRQQRELDARAQAWRRAEAPGLATEATGVSIVFAHLSQRNIESMLTGTIIAMALISLILILVFRSVRLGLVSLVPNFIPAAMAFGLWGYLVGHVGLAGSVVTAIAFGMKRRRRYDPFPDQIPQGPPRGARRARSCAHYLPHCGSCAMDHDRRLVSLLPGVRHIGVRTELGTRPPGHAHARLRAARRFPASSAAADGYRSEKDLIGACCMVAISLI